MCSHRRPFLSDIDFADDSSVGTHDVTELLGRHVAIKPRERGHLISDMELTSGLHAVDHANLRHQGDTVSLNTSRWKHTPNTTTLSPPTTSDIHSMRQVGLH